MHWVLRLYPPDWREQYEEELLAVLEQHNVRTRTVVDLLLGAMDANIRLGVIQKRMVSLAKRTAVVVCALALGWVAYEGYAWAGIPPESQSFGLESDAQQIDHNIAIGHVLPIHRISAIQYKLTANAQRGQSHR